MPQVKERVKTRVKENVAPDVAQAQSEGRAKPPVGTPDNPSDKVLTLANLITVCRFLLTIAFLVLFVHDSKRNVALVFYTVAAVTDFLDGWVARATQTVSWFGKVSDPVMDRVLLFTGVLGLVAVGDLPLWVAVFVIGRDLVLFGGTIYLHKFWRRPVDVIYTGKLSTALFMTGFCILLIDAPQVVGPHLVDARWLPGFNGQSVAVGIYLVYLAVIFSTITAVTYYRRGFAIRDRVLAERATESG
ncbi:MAG: CDP-alcohol phosphatidyltransferase family protein [Acidobacteriota bacterium]|nr:CDP-alcohol phosphatidyltransferase family protein [Acidobacteriota bacterium]